MASDNSVPTSAMTRDELTAAVLVMAARMHSKEDYTDEREAVDYAAQRHARALQREHVRVGNRAVNKTDARERGESYLITAANSKSQVLALLAIANLLVSIDTHLMQLASPTKISFTHTKQEEVG